MLQKKKREKERKKAERQKRRKPVEGEEEEEANSRTVPRGVGGYVGECRWVGVGEGGVRGWVVGCVAPKLHWFSQQSLGRG